MLLLCSRVLRYGASLADLLAVCCCHHPASLCCFLKLFWLVGSVNIKVRANLNVLSAMLLSS